MISKRSLPPKDLPKNLSADEYFLVSVQYMLLGSLHMSLKAATKAVAGRSVYGSKFLTLYSTRSGTNFGSTKPSELQYSLVLMGLCGVDLSLAVLIPGTKFLWEAAGAGSNILENLNSMIDPAKSAKKKAEASKSDEYDNISRAIARSSLPEGLSADEYYKLGKQYKQNGWIGLSQEALHRVAVLAPNSQVATEAMRYLQTKVPKGKVSIEIEQKNIEGYHAVAKNDLPKAREVFEALMKSHPDFEWPYLNLATAYHKDGQPEKAKFLLRKLLSINPDHVEAWDSLARVYAAEFDLPEAQEAIAKAVELFPEETQMKTLIDCLAALN